MLLVEHLHAVDGDDDVTGEKSCFCRRFSCNHIVDQRFGIIRNDAERHFGDIRNIVLRDENCLLDSCAFNFQRDIFAEEIEIDGALDRFPVFHFFPVNRNDLISSLQSCFCSGGIFDHDPDLCRLHERFALHVIDPPEDPDGQKNIHDHTGGDNDHSLPYRF